MLAMKHDGAYTPTFRRYACGNGCCGQCEHLCAQQNNKAKENQERIIRTVTSRTDGKTVLFKQKTGYARADFIWGSLQFFTSITEEIDPGALEWLQENARTTDRTAFGTSSKRQLPR